MTSEEFGRCRRDFEVYYKKQLQFPDQVIERKGPTYDYNCHELTFLCRRAWFDEDVPGDPIGMVLVDDGYETVKPEDVRPGDIVVYRKPSGLIEHTGVVVWVDKHERPPSPWVVSKWANLGEYIHKVGNSPYRGQASYMREASNGTSGVDR